MWHSCSAQATSLLLGNLTSFHHLEMKRAEAENDGFPQPESLFPEADVQVAYFTLQRCRCNHDDFQGW